MTRTIIITCLAALLTACSSAAIDNQPDDPSVLPFKDAKSSTSGGNLIDHGGKVLPVSNTYAIWWGNQAAFPADAKSGLDAMFEGLTGTSYLGIASQYMRGASVSSSFHTNWIDLSSPPNHSPSVSVIAGEACKMISQNGATPDPAGLYLVYTSNFPHLSFCAWHSHSVCNGVDIAVAYMPNTAGVAGCDPGNLYGCNYYSQGTRSLANVSAHETFETISDTDLNAWYNSAGSEAGDLCSWQFSNCVSLTTGSWQLQEMWSNNISACQQQ